MEPSFARVLPVLLSSLPVLLLGLAYSAPPVDPTPNLVLESTIATYREAPELAGRMDFSIELPDGRKGLKLPPPLAAATTGEMEVFLDSLGFGVLSSPEVSGMRRVATADGAAFEIHLRAENGTADVTIDEASRRLLSFLARRGPRLRACRPPTGGRFRGPGGERLPPRSAGARCELAYVGGRFAAMHTPGLPSTVIIAPDGTLVRYHSGLVADMLATLKREVEELGS